MARAATHALAWSGRRAAAVSESRVVGGGLAGDPESILATGDGAVSPPSGSVGLVTDSTAALVAGPVGGPTIGSGVAVTGGGGAAGGSSAFAHGSGTAIGSAGGWSSAGPEAGSGPGSWSTGAGIDAVAGAGDAGGGVSSNSAIATCRNELAVTVASTPCRPNAKSGWSGTETTIVAEPLASVTDDARSTAPAPPSRLTWSTPPGGKPATVATIGVPAGPDTGLRRISAATPSTPCELCRYAALSTGTTHVVVAPCTPSRSYRRAGGATWMVGAMPARPTAGSGWLRSRFETLWATVPYPPNS